jgi:hypothetical protein
MLGGRGTAAGIAVFSSSSVGGNSCLDSEGFKTFRMLYSTFNVCQDVRIRAHVFCRYICNETARHDIVVSTSASYQKGPKLDS